MRQVGEGAVVARVSGDVQQTARAAGRGRVLGDQFGREVEVEIVEGEHAENVKYRKVACR